MDFFHFLCPKVLLSHIILQTGQYIFRRRHFEPWVQEMKDLKIELGYMGKILYAFQLATMCTVNWSKYT